MRSGQPFVFKFVAENRREQILLAGKCRKISASLTSASRAMAAVVVPLKPRAAKSSRAAATIRSRLERDARLLVAILLTRASFR